jgi:serine/threonine protein kinase
MRQEFGHLITMVAATYITRSQITGFRQLDQGSFGLIYSAAYDGSSVAVKQCSSVSVGALSCYCCFRSMCSIPATFSMASLYGRRVCDRGPCQDGSQIKAKMRELLLELSVLVRIRHPNIVTFWGTAADFPISSGGKPYIGMVFELCSRGSLYKALHQTPGKQMPFKEKMRYCLQVARGMSYIHAKGIIHRDLNSRNVLITNEGHAKVADFGCARKVKGAVLQTTTISGSPAYMAPEQLDGADLTDKIDVWAYGVLMWEMACEQVPWASKGNSLDALKRAVCTAGERLPLPTADRFPQGWR